MKQPSVFDAVFAGSVVAVLAGIVGGGLSAFGTRSLGPETAGGGAALGGILVALLVTPPLIGHLLGAGAFRHIVSGYAFAMLGLLVLGTIVYMYVPAVQALPTLLAASAAAGIRLSQLAD